MHKRCGFLRKFCFVLVLFLCVNLGHAKLEIIVKPSPDWGPISDADVEYLCQEIVDRFEEHLRLENEIHDNVNVYRKFGERTNIFTLDIADPDVKYKIGIWLFNDMDITTKDFRHFICSFSHEFTHLLHKYEVGLSPNKWFTEAIAEMGCVWALRRMADTWKHGSRFGTGVPVEEGWTDFSENFDFYADWYMSLPPEHYGTGEEWIEEYEDYFRDEYERTGKVTEYPIMAQLGYKFLPIFEEHPEAWNAVRKMPTTEGKMSVYMQDWYDAVDIQDRQYVEGIAEIMGIKVTAPVLVSIESDAVEFVYLTFTHKADTSLTSVNNSNDWDGWVAGIWEKTPDGIIGKRSGIQSDVYKNFPFMNEWEHWMYSHAPSIIEYDISGNAYNRFTSHFDITHPGCQHEAEIQFLAYADDKEIFRSEVLYTADDGMYIEFDIPKDAKKLKIRIADVVNNWCDHFVLGEPKLYIDHASGLEAGNIDADVNDDGYVDLYDVMIVRSGMLNPTSYDTDLNNDGVTDEVDLHIVKSIAMQAIAAAAPGKKRVNITTWGSLKMR